MDRKALLAVKVTEVSAGSSEVPARAANEAYKV